MQSFTKPLLVAAILPLLTPMHAMAENAKPATPKAKAAKKSAAVSEPEAAAPAPAQENAYGFPGKFTGNAGFVSDYSFRGISQTREKPALQGGIDYAHPSGFYVGVWGSSIDFNDTDRASLEVDGYGGYSYIIDKWTLDGRFTYYAYPGAKTALDYDYYELGGSVTYDFGIPKLTGSVNYSPDYFGESGTGMYYSLSTKVPLVYGFGVNGKIGHQSIDDAARFGVPSYTDWSAGITYDWRGFQLGLQYVDTNLSTSKCADGCDAKGIASVAYAF